MSEYRAPIRDMQFVLNELAGLDELARLPGCEEATPDVVDAILEEAAKFAEEVLSPLNASGDKEGARFADGKVTTPKGFKEAYKLFAESGWTALAASRSGAGQGLPRLVATPVAGNVEIGQSRLFAVSVADRWRDRCAGAFRV
jgi:Acyl-CoA dehydrogenase N terminal.